MEAVIASTLEAFRNSNIADKPVLRIKSTQVMGDDLIKYEVIISKRMNFYTVQQNKYTENKTYESGEIKFSSVDMNTLNNWAPGHIWAVEYIHNL